MGPDFIERFFKLTLDNVYRFLCSLVFTLALVAWWQQNSVSEQAREPMTWLAIPATWLTSVDEWIAERQEAAGVVALLMLMIAVFFATEAENYRSRAGATALLAMALLVQAGYGSWVISAPLVCATLLVAITGTGAFAAHQIGWSTPRWTVIPWEKFGLVLLAMLLAALYLLSPLGWLISHDPRNTRGSRQNPLYVENAGSSSEPTGAKS